MSARSELIRGHRAELKPTTSASEEEALSAQQHEALGEPLPEDAGPDGLRKLFRRHAAAVAVVTTTFRDEPVGLLVTSLASVSAAPPLISFNVSRGSSSWPALREARHVGVHLLAHDQEHLAGRFARKGAERFGAPTSWYPGPFRTPVLDGVAARSIAEVEQRVPAGDHVIVVARLLTVDTLDEVSPLLHHDGAYHLATPLPVSRLSVVRES
jgi:flavin reductase (DIM6/NTAB) family NADH-FMN oxidoreductase RutF